MLIDSNITKDALVVIFAAAFCVLSLTKSGRRSLFIVMGAMLVILGVAGLLTGKVLQKNNGAPPLDGSTAIVGSFCLLGAGIAVLILSLMRRIAEARNNTTQDETPNGNAVKKPNNNLP